MSTISSPGLASGIDIKSIVSQLAALDRAPLQRLKQSASSLRSQLSVYGSLKSMMSSLGDAAANAQSAASPMPPFARDAALGGSNAGIF